MFFSVSGRAWPSWTAFLVWSRKSECRRSHDCRNPDSNCCGQVLFRKPESHWKPLEAIKIGVKRCNNLIQQVTRLQGLQGGSTLSATRVNLALSHSLFKILIDWLYLIEHGVFGHHAMLQYRRWGWFRLRSVKRTRKYSWQSTRQDLNMIIDR